MVGAFVLSSAANAAVVIDGRPSTSAITRPSSKSLLGQGSSVVEEHASSCDKFRAPETLLCSAHDACVD